MPDTSTMSDTHGSVTPEFIVDLSRPPGAYPGVITIRAQNTYTSRSDIHRWLTQCLRELEDELRRVEIEPNV